MVDWISANAKVLLIIAAITVIAGTGLVAAPVGFGLVFLTGNMNHGLMTYINEELFGMPVGWLNRVDIRRFWEFWIGGIGFQVVYVLIYSVFAFKVKLRLYLLSALVGNTVFWMVFSGDFVRPTTPGWGGIGYHIANTFLFAVIMFAVFVVLTILLDKYTKWREWVKIPVSFLMSIAVGGLLSYLVWIALFQIFHST